MIGLAWALAAALALTATGADPVFDRIRVLAEENDFEQAGKLLQEHLGKGKPAHRVSAALALANEWERVEARGKTVWLLQELAAIYPDWPGAGANLANGLHRAGQDEKAQAVFHEWIGRFPNESNLRNDLGLLYQARGRRDLAETEFCEAIRLGDEDAPANLLILWRISGKVAEGREVLEALLRERPQSAWARRGYALWRLDRMQRSAKIPSRF